MRYNEQDQYDPALRQRVLSQMQQRTQVTPSVDGPIGAGPRGPLNPPTGTAEPLAAEPAAAPYQAKGPSLGLEGFNAEKLASGHVSPKYVFAKHAQGLGVNDRDELLRRLQADESGYFKNASWGGSKGDILQIGGELDPKFNGLSKFDVIRAMGEGGKGWQWSDAEAGGRPALSGPDGLPMTMQSPYEAAMPTDQDFTKTLMARLQDIIGGQNVLTREALLNQMKQAK